VSRRALVLLLAGVLCAGACDSGRHVRPTQASTLSSTVHAPSPSSAVPSSSNVAKPGPRTVTVLGSGDVLVHPPVWAQAAADARDEGKTGFDFAPMFAAVAPVTRAADVAICELETPLALPGGPFAGYPTFSAPPQVLTALRLAGYDSCTTASNHTLDQGDAGLTRTLDELDAAGLEHTGSARSAAEAARPLIITTANGAKVAQLAYSFGFNGLSTPPGKAWQANLIDVAAVMAAAHRAKAAGADIVVLSMHWGIEYDHGVTSEQDDQARALLASPDIDVILGDHSHAVEPFERIGRKWVAYSMGDQISRHAAVRDDDREGVMPRFTFTEVAPHRWRVTKAEAVPTWIDIAPKIRIVDLPAALASPATSAARRAVYQAARARIVHYLDARGGVRDGLVIG
jgi:hypothetical protein